MKLATPEARLEFWSQFTASLVGSSFQPPSPSTRNYVYLSTGTSRAKIVLTAPTASGGIAVKLALGRSIEATAVYRELYAERESIEAELGFAVDWGMRGPGLSPTRIYRQRAGGMRARSDWPEAHDWLLDTAARFQKVIVPRVRRSVLGLLTRSGDRPRDSDAAHVRPVDATPADVSLPQPVADGSVSAGRPVTRGETQDADVLVTDAEALAAVETLAEWSRWVPLRDAINTAPREAGVYLARRGADGPVVYVGMAGERAGSGRAQGLRGRLAVYASGKGLVSGLGEAALDRALADPEWLAERLAELERGAAIRAKEWGRQAVLDADIHTRWTICADRESARRLEEECLGILRGVDLWNCP